MKNVKKFENLCWLVTEYLQFSSKISHSGCCYFVNEAEKKGKYNKNNDCERWKLEITLYELTW